MKHLMLVFGATSLIAGTVHAQLRLIDQDYSPPSETAVKAASPAKPSLNTASKNSASARAPATPARSDGAASPTASHAVVPKEPKPAKPAASAPLTTTPATVTATATASTTSTAPSPSPSTAPTPAPATANVPKAETAAPTSAVTAADASPVQTAPSAPVEVKPVGFAASRSDNTIRDVLVRWAAISGWTHDADHWSVDKDHPVEGAAGPEVFGYEFKAAVRTLLASTENSDLPVQPCFYSNKVLRVIPRAASCDRAAN